MNEIKLMWNIPKTVYKSTPYAGKKIVLHTLTEKRTVEIVSMYGLGRYPAYETKVVESKYPELLGQRENLLGRDIIRNGKLVDKIKILAR